MNTETHENTTQVEDKEDSKSTPERPLLFSPLVPEENEENEKSNDSHNTEIKPEPPDIEQSEANQEPQVAGNSCVESLTSEVPENSTAANESSKVTETILSDMNEVRVKDEPGIEGASAIDYDMPLEKTPGYNTTEIQNDNTNEMQNETNSNTANVSNTTFFEEAAEKAALDAFLDGIATTIPPPVRPRLRVKTEFSLIPTQTPQQELVAENLTPNQGCDNMDTDISPPPPPLISSTLNSDYLLDGITTPRISLAAINRLRVKSEFSVPRATPQHSNEDDLSIPEDFFNDLLEKKEGNNKEAGELSESNSEGASEDEPIPEDFFDDLLRDNLKERIEQAKNSDWEEKRLKNELKRVEEKRENRKNRKKLKKAKKKSRKRIRSRSLSLSPSNKTKDTHFNDLENTSSRDKNKRKRVSSPCHNEMSPSHDSLRVDRDIQIKSEFLGSNFDNVTTECTSFVQNVEEIEEVLTPKQKRERAVKRAAALLNHIKDSTTSDDNSAIFSTFPFVSTVRKLPTSHSYVQQRIYENRSPLHTVNNVSYKFNSNATRFNMEEWGLAALPTHAAKIAKLVGCNAQFIHTKLKTIKIPAKLKKLKQEAANHETNNDNDEEDFIETISSLCCNAMTQTDDLKEFNRPLKTQLNEIGVQVAPSVYSIGSQTLETQSPKEDSSAEDASIMNIIRDLNENQLMAIHQFAELIRQPNDNSSALEMYKMQMQILEIYKISQIPSALTTPQTHAVNSYTTTTTHSLPSLQTQATNSYTANTTISPSKQSRAGGYKHMQQQPIIQSIRSADGSQYSINDPTARTADGNKFSINDPRARSAVYTKRVVVNDDAASSFSSHDPRYISANQGYSHTTQARLAADEDRYYNNSNKARTTYPYHKENPTPPVTTKFYGRGGMRRS